MVLNSFLRSLTLVFNLDSSRNGLRVRTTWPRRRVGGGGGAYSTKFKSGRLHPEVQPLTPLTEEVPLSYSKLSLNGHLCKTDT